MIIMLKSILLFFISVIFLSSGFVQAASFGPQESQLLFDGRKSSLSYRINNSDSRLPWLVQAWVEDENEKKTNLFTSVPLVFRVEPSSSFTVRVIKNGNVNKDMESLFWVVSNSLPGGAKEEVNTDKTKVEAQLSLAYRFKVPMIYRPASLVNVPQKPESLVWTSMAGEKLKVHNPSRYVIQLNYIKSRGNVYRGKGYSYFILPMKSVTLDVKLDSGSKINYGVVNDYGALREYEGIVH